MLEVSSPKQSGYFFIKNGEIKGGEVGKLRGAPAVELAGSFVDGSFQFKPLEPTDYSRIVWEKSFGPNRLVAHAPHIRVEAFRTMLGQFLSYAESAYGILQRDVVSLAERALRQFLFYAPAAYRSLENTGVSIARRTLAYTTAAYESSTRSEFGRKLLPALRKALAEWQIALRRSRKLILKYARSLSFPSALSYQGVLGLIRKKAAMLPSLQEATQSNISFVVILVAILVSMAVTISQIMRSNQDHVDTLATTDEDIQTAATTDETIGTESQARERHVSWERAKRKPQIDRETPTEKKRDTSLGQNSKFVPATVSPPTNVAQPPTNVAQASTNAVQAPRNAASDSDVPKTQPVPTSGVQTIPVVLQIENGRVSQASLLKHRTGMERYEAAALRIARQRRYPTAGKHTETVVVKVNAPHPN